MIDEIFIKRNMAHGFKFKKGALRWIWVLCVAVHVTSCEGVLRRDDIRGIEFFPLMNKGRSDAQQNQAVVGKKIDLEEVKKWFSGLLAYVNKYRDELKSIRGTVDTYQGDSGHKLDGLQYKEQRIALPFQKSEGSVDLLIITGDKSYPSLFLGKSDTSKKSSDVVATRTLYFGFPGRANDSNQSGVNRKEDLKISGRQDWPQVIDAEQVGIEIDQTGSNIDFDVQKRLPLSILAYIESMAGKIGVSRVEGIDCVPVNSVKLMHGICKYFRDSHLNNGDNLKHLFDGAERSELAEKCVFTQSDQGNDIFDCKMPLSFVAFEPVDSCIRRAENIGKRIETFSEKLCNQIREKRGKSKDNRVFMAHDDFQKQYGQEIIGVLTSVKSLFGKTSSSIGSEMLGYEEEISRCFSDISDAIERYGKYQLDVLQYMTYSVLHHASKLISDSTFTPDFAQNVFVQECLCVNIGIINTLNMIHVLYAHDKMLKVFSKDNVKGYMDSLRKRYKALISIADKVAMTSDKGLTISDMKEMLDIKI